MNTHFDVIVVGAGSMGMAAGYYLSRQGVKTLLIDAFDPPHPEGSHHGDTRIIRHAYGEGREYVPLALRAQTLWHELEKETHHKIFTQTGVLGFGPKNESEFIDEAMGSAEHYSLPVELMRGDEINLRWPGLNVPEDFVSIFEPDSGVLFSENCIRAYRELATAYGASFLTNTPVEDIDVHDDSAEVFTKDGAYTANKLIISTGAWNGKIFEKLNLNLPLQPHRQTVGWFECDESLYQSNVFPAFMVEVPTGIYYGFPSFSGCGLKIGRHDFGQQIDPDYINREFGIYPEDEGYIRRFLEDYMTPAAGKLKQGKVCMYTKTPDEHFILDLHPEHSHVAVAGGFSGHGFKFSSVVGEVLSQLAMDGKTEHDISLFSITRPALRQSV
ncbi:sarcosine oxidase/N-methyl-L-tryptophan oxidase [Scopulibacillus darangshiensis]|uniref:Sarcosine oxidase/N-methyl-L-tryptophan oxidase n=1 Tax=Scopulibacillus darangshiensis TaxID=442528 RepID=A0A4R2NHK5_9BACL|nr:N-methyl-L-tryptophan oxidase [Scopulibacillus darangshiensis]TCP20712.1 sarcosine oxidase/N-methyl-L-tryptophan oxidase [Scopulibacillus darangshiensis]